MPSLPRWKILLCFVAIALTARAADLPQVIEIWPGAVPGETGRIPAESPSKTKAGKVLPEKTTNVTRATLTVFRPAKEHDTGAAVLVFPGGGYRELEMDKEGEEPARWINSLGLTAFVLKYRVPTRDGLPRYLPALQDAQRALSLVRSNAPAWGLKPDHLGLLCFSAGSNLGVMVSTHYDQRSYAATDTIDAVSCRPDFTILAYPGALLDKDGHLIPEVTVTKNTPQTFIVQAETDRVDSDNSIQVYLALKHAGVPAELHIYTAGEHGFGVRTSSIPLDTWTERCADWLRGQGILPQH